MQNFSYNSIKLNPLQNNRTKLKLSVEQIAIDKQRGEKVKQSRPPKSVDYLRLPTLAFSDLKIRYDEKYKKVEGERDTRTYRLNLYRLFLFIIYNTHQTNHVPQSEYFNLSSDILKLYFGKNNNKISYAQIRKDLEDWGYLECDHTYAFNSKADKAKGICKDVKAKGYKLTQKLIEDKWGFETVRGLKYGQKTEKSFAERTTKLILDDKQPQYRLLKRNLLRVGIDEKAAFAWIDEAEKSKLKLKDKEKRIDGKWVKLTNRIFTAGVADSYRMTVQEINRRKADGEPLFKVINTNNRLDTGITNLPSLLRKFVTVDVVEGDVDYLDLTASQVYLLLPLLEKTIAVRSSDKKDFNEFKVLVTKFRGGNDNNFYEELAQILKDKTNYQVEGDEKTEFFKHVLYSNTHINWGYRQAFNKLFPTISNGIIEIFKNGKKNNDENLAILLQKMESSIFIDKICARVFNELGEGTFLLTFHDGLICEIDERDEIYNIMLEVLKEETGNAANIKFDSFQNPQKKIKKKIR